MRPTHKESLLMHPANYVEVQICPVIKSNDMKKEIVWTYLVARRYEKDLKTLSKILCGQDEEIHNNSKIWLEAYLHPTRTRQDEVRYWRSRADLSVGHLESVENRELQIRSNGDWVCLCESKWFEDIHENSKFPEILQFSQLIEHAILLHDKEGNFPKRVYITLITPRYFRDQLGTFSQRKYFKKYHDYKSSKELLEKDLRLCPLPFLKHDINILISRIGALKFNWITFEELLSLTDLVRDQIPGKYQISFNTWEEVLKQMGREDLFDELQNKG